LFIYLNFILLDEILIFNQFVDFPCIIQPDAAPYCYGVTVSGYVLLLFLLLRWGETGCVCVCGTAAGSGPITHPSDGRRVNMEQR
jgi:hypothetical protein